VISLTKTGKKSSDSKKNHVADLRECLDTYDSVYVMKYNGMRTSFIREVRMDWKESRLYFGKNTLAQVALGRNVEEEYKDNLHNMSKRLTGNSALLFTNRGKKETLKYFKNFKRPDFAKAGEKASEDVILMPGMLEFPVSMLDQLRKLGMVVEVNQGKVELKVKWVAAKKGELLNAEQAKALVHLDKKLGLFQLTLDAFWHDGQFTEL
jgi:mRNA turnover protein 4